MQRGLLLGFHEFRLKGSIERRQLDVVAELIYIDAELSIAVCGMCGGGPATGWSNEGRDLPMDFDTRRGACVHHRETVRANLSRLDRLTPPLL